MLIVQKEVSNVQITGYGEKEIKEIDKKFPSTIEGKFDALKWCEYTINGKHNKLSFGVIGVDADFYLRLLEGLTAEKPIWSSFSAKINDVYRQGNGIDIQHTFTMHNFTQLEVSHKNNASGELEEIIFTLS